MWLTTRRLRETTATKMFQAVAATIQKNNEVPNVAVYRMRTRYRQIRPWSTLVSSLRCEGVVTWGGTVIPGGGGGCAKKGGPENPNTLNHLEERLLDQAQMRLSYTPLFWGRSRSIPQGMVSDV